MKEHKKFEALIVLGKNWKEYPPKKLPKGWKLKLSSEARLSCLAAGELYNKVHPDKIIFSSGKTAGKDWPSEAKAMWDYTKNIFPKIPNKAIILEEDSIDTADNAEKVFSILKKNNIKKTALLTIGFHLQRSKKIFANFGIKAHGFASEKVLQKSPDYQKLLQKHKSSSNAKMEKLKEFFLRMLLYIDPKANIPRIFIKGIRSPER